jgi:mRNA-degrading endonuclease RelE of RelBE toxin-antitoxin system
MKLIFSKKAEEELDNADANMKKLFIRHAEKIAAMPPRRHMKFGLPFNVEGVTKQARIIYCIEEDGCYILHCFKNHKEYERWYKSFK